MLVAWILIAAAAFGLVVLAILGFGLFGQVTRLLKAAETARADLQPRIEALRAEEPAGRHRA